MDFILLIKYMILGCLQGFTEPLPISSSGHIFIIKQIIDSGLLNDLNFEIIVNTGSLFAILIIFRKDIFKIIKDFCLYIKTKDEKYKSNFKYSWLIVIGVIPVGIIGVLFKDNIEDFLNNIKIVGIAFLVTALFLFLVRNKNGKKNTKDINIIDAIFIGIIQIIAVIPGISRSGSTLIAGMYRNINKSDALKYSFMLYIPISFATLILGIKDLINSSNFSEVWIYYLFGFIASFIVTLFSTRWFMDILKKGKLIYFSFYALLVGILVIIFL